MADSLSFLAIQVFGLLPAATWQSWIWSHRDGAVLLVRLPPLLVFRYAIIIAVHCNCYPKIWLLFLSVLPSFFGDLWCYHHFLLVISGYIQQAAETTSNKWWQHTATATRKKWFTSSGRHFVLSDTSGNQVADHRRLKLMPPKAAGDKAIVLVIQQWFQPPKKWQASWFKNVRVNSMVYGCLWYIDMWK
jgi:hypothetical protein